MSLPFWAIGRPPTVSDSKRPSPCLRMRQRKAPVSISMAEASAVVLMAAAGAAAVPGDSCSGPAVSGAALMAWPVHMSEPSGQ